MWPHKYYYLVIYSKTFKEIISIFNNFNNFNFIYNKL